MNQNKERPDVLEVGSILNRIVMFLEHVASHPSIATLPTYIQAALQQEKTHFWTLRQMQQQQTPENQSQLAPQTGVNAEEAPRTSKVAALLLDELLCRVAILEEKLAKVVSSLTPPSPVHVFAELQRKADELNQEAARKNPPRNELDGAIPVSTVSGPQGAPDVPPRRIAVCVSSLTTIPIPWAAWMQDGIVPLPSQKANEEEFVYVYDELAGKTAHRNCVKQLRIEDFRLSTSFPGAPPVIDMPRLKAAILGEASSG